MVISNKNNNWGIVFLLSPIFFIDNFVRKLYNSIKERKFAYINKRCEVTNLGLHKQITKISTCTFERVVKFAYMSIDSVFSVK